MEVMMINRDGEYINILDMTTDEIIAERRYYEDIIENCKFETPEEIEDLFEAYTVLIWKHKQVGRVYDFYYDALEEVRDGGDNLEGSDHVVEDTLRALNRTPDLNVVFCDIHCTGNPVDGFRFGQILYNTGCSKDGIGPYGPGNGLSYEPFEDLEMCECWVEFVDGKWRVSKEASIRSTEAYKRVLINQ